MKQPWREMSAWEDGSCTFVENVESPCETISIPWDALLKQGQETKELDRRRSSFQFDPQKHLARLVLHGCGFDGKVVELNTFQVRLGSAPENQIIVDDAAVSPYHCIFHFAEKGWHVRDLFTLTGSYINGWRITEAPLYIGDVVRVGALVVKFEVSLIRHFAAPSSPSQTSRIILPPKTGVFQRHPTPPTYHSDAGLRMAPIRYVRPLKMRQKIVAWAKVAALFFLVAALVSQAVAWVKPEWNCIKIFENFLWK